MASLLSSCAASKATISKVRPKKQISRAVQALPYSARNPNLDEEDAIVVKDVRLKLGNKGAKRPILNGVNLTVKRGSLHMLLGPNGCGKSTLLKILGGLLQPDEGTVIMDKSTGFVFQNPDHQVVMPTVAADVAFGLGRYELSEEEVQRMVLESLTLVNLQDFRFRATHTLSGGQRQRVAIAGALAEGPRVLLLDELTTFLDVEDQTGVLKAVRRITTDGGGGGGGGGGSNNSSNGSSTRSLHSTGSRGSAGQGQGVPDTSSGQSVPIGGRLQSPLSSSSNNNPGSAGNGSKIPTGGSASGSSRDGVARGGVTALWVTHRFEELEYADAVSYMENGMVVFTGSPQDARDYMRTLESPI